MRHYLKRVGVGESAQTSSAVRASSATSVAMRPTGQNTPSTVGLGRGHGGASDSSGPMNRIYALSRRQD